MPLPDMPLSGDARRAAFAALVADQDAGVDVAASRARVAAGFGLVAEQVRDIEREGINGRWPPLGDAAE